MNERLMTAVPTVHPDIRFSRRSLMRAVSAAAASWILMPDGRAAIDKGMCRANILWPREKAYSQYDAYVKDYPHASQETYASVFSSLDIRPVNSTVQVQRFTGTDRLVRIETTLDSDQVLLLDISSGYFDPDWGLRAVEVKTDERDYYNPIIVTDQNNTGRMTLGQQRAGRIAIDIMETRFSRGITAANLGVQLLTVEGNDVCMALMRLLNVLYLREDNDTEDGFLNDFPILAEAYLRENVAAQKLMWEEWIKLTSQDGGTPLCRALNDNNTTNDNEVLGIDTLTEEALLEERVDQEENHAIVAFERFDPPILVTDKINVSKQLNKMNNMTKRNITSTHAVALFPYLPSFGGITPFYAHLKLAAEVFGARERLRQGGIDQDFVKKIAKRVGRDIVSERFAFKDFI